MEEPPLLQEPEAEVVEEKTESPQPEQAKASVSQASSVLKIFRTNIEPLAEARLKHVKTYEGAAFHRHLYKGQGGTQ